MPYKDPETKRKYQREWRARRRQEWIDENGPCARCGSSDRLEVDHVDPTKKVDHVIWSWSRERREAELAKCQVLCHDCHLEKTKAARASEVEHGSSTMYGKRKCRCRICRAGNAQRMREWRERTVASSSSG